jgi:hypothetical protein
LRPVPEALSRRTAPARLALALLGALALGGGLGAACGEDDEAALRREVLAHLAGEVIVPAHDELAAAADELAGAVADLCDAPAAAALTAARDRWTRTRGAWSVTGAWAFGPLVEQMAAGPLDFWPVRVDTVEAAITTPASPAAIDAAYLAGLGTSAKGLPALEYLLFGDPPDAAAVLAALTDGKRCAYAVVLAADIAARTGDLAAGWRVHADELTTAGRGSAVYASEQAALDALVNAAIEDLYAIVKTRLDRPLGNLTGSDPDPALLESRFSGEAAAGIAGALDGFAATYFGADGEPGGAPGLGALVAARDARLDERIAAQYDLARAALAAIPPPLATALTADRAAVQTARDEIDALRRLIKLDLASLLGVTLSLSDNDGD